MKIIKSIRIKNFRSILNTTRGNVMEFSTDNLNIIVGENDAGKSNILKALNLFFNGVTDILTPFNYDKDLSVQRIGQRKVNKDIEIELIISPPQKQNFSFTSKGDIRWTKTWHPDNQPMSEKFEYVEAPHIDFQKDLRNTYFKWLKKIKFKYIPAIKSDRYFSSLMSDLYDSLPSKIEGINEDWLGEKGFIANIQHKTEKISTDLKSHLGFESVIQFPGDFRELFSTLEFSDKTTKIALNRKGDGIKVRHIPIILKYMADQEIYKVLKVNREPIANTIWGFEEPENNLEFKSEQKLANLFQNFVKGNNTIENDEGIQLFITSHSPVFYTISDYEFTNTFFVKKNDDGSSEIKTIPKDEKGKKEIERQMNLDPLIALSSKWKELNSSIKIQQKKITELSQRIQDLTKPILVTEGKTDTTILKYAWSKLYESEMPFDIIPADTSDPNDSNGGYGGASVLAHFANSVMPSDPIRIVLWDYDKEGLKHFELNKNFSKFENYDYIKVHNNRKSFALVLPPHDDLSDFIRAQNMPIEFYFDKSDYVKKDQNGKGLELKKEEIIRTFGEIKKTFELTEPWFCKISGDKVAFAENVVPTLSVESFHRFKLLFETINNKILTSS